MECNRHDGWNRPIGVHLPFSQTQLVKMVMWEVQYIKRQEFWFSLQSTQCKQEAANSLSALKLQHYLSFRLSHLQTSQSTETVMLSKLVMWPVKPIIFSWWQSSSRSVYFASWGKIDIAWVTQKYRYQLSEMKKHWCQPQKNLLVEL